MAYNSDGYIMIDFTEVDFRRTNQTIEGLYKRCVDVIGTNKFILVINANGRTPLPATCSFTNNQYVIDTCIYMFAISSNDNLFIRRNDVPASGIIDDSSISVDKTWSSNKIDAELDGKADVSALANYQPLLTAGDNINIVNNVISSNVVGAIKSFTYKGTGTTPTTITFPTKPTIVFQIFGTFQSYVNYSGMIFRNTEGTLFQLAILTQGTSTLLRPLVVNWTSDTTLELTGETPQRALNAPNIEYTVYYI